MKTQDKVLNLFCVYTLLSVVISILAWASVGTGLISVSPIYTSGISGVAWILGAAIYLIAIYLVYQLHNRGRVSIATFGAYFLLQTLALGHGFLSYGWYYAPTAGSQGTIPAVLISLLMLVYLFSKNHETLTLA